jgi:hypothetical protein
LQAKRSRKRITDVQHYCGLFIDNDLLLGEFIDYTTSANKHERTDAKEADNKADNDIDMSALENTEDTFVK